jgi:hypothetical protein
LGPRAAGPFGQQQTNSTNRNEEHGVNMKLRDYLGISYLGAVLTVACALPSFANGSNSHTRTINLTRDVVVAGTTLAAGKYTMRWEEHSPEAKVEFVRHNEVLASVAGRLEQRNKKYPQNEVVYNQAPNGSLSVNEIRFGGSSEALVFNQ